MQEVVENAIRRAVGSVKNKSGMGYPGVRCQGKGGICPNLGTHRTSLVPGVYCEICMTEVDRTVSIMRKYVADRGLFNQDEIVETLRAKGFTVKVETTAEGKNAKKRNNQVQAGGRGVRLSRKPHNEASTGGLSGRGGPSGNRVKAGH